MITETAIAIAAILFTAEAECDISLYDPATDDYSEVAGPYRASVSKDEAGVFVIRDAFGDGSTFEFTLTYSPMFNDYDINPRGVLRTETYDDGSEIYFLAGEDGAPLSMHIDLNTDSVDLPEDLTDLRILADQSYVTVDSENCYHAYMDFAGLDEETDRLSPWLTIHITWIPGEGDDAIETVTCDDADSAVYYDLLGIRHDEQPRGYSIRLTPSGTVTISNR